jgi:hypothetical protein
MCTNCDENNYQQVNICTEAQIPCDCPVKDLSTDCVNFDQEDLKYDATTVVPKNTILTVALDNIIQFLKIKIEELQNYFKITNTGLGAKIYSGNTLLGEKKLRTITSSNDSVSIVEGVDDIDITVQAIAPDGSETKLQAGTNTTVSGNGTTATPYTVNVTLPTIDGSETKVQAGTNVTVTGDGTIVTPYVIDVGTPTLQEVLDAGNYAAFEGGFNNSATILGGSSFDRNVTFNVDNGIASNSGNEGGFFILENNVVELQGYNDAGRGDVLIVDGLLEFSQYNRINNKKTTVLFTSPVSTSTIVFPAKPLDGTFTIATLDDIPTGEDSVLQKINEGNGIGIIIKDRIAANYGNIGLNAIDLSYSGSASSVLGATGRASFASGDSTQASGQYSTALGADTIASGNFSFASGSESRALGDYAHAEGEDTLAAGLYSHSEGIDSEANGIASHVEGSTTIADGNSAHAEGSQTYASGDYSHAEGFNSDAFGIGSHAGGFVNAANSYCEFSTGLYGTKPAGSATTYVATDRLFNIGNGTSDVLRSNAFTVLKNGLATLPSVTNTLIESDSGKAVVTKEYLSRQKEIISNYTVVNADNDQTIFINNGATPITITLNTTVTTPNFGVGFIQQGLGDVTFVGTGITLSNPIGLKSKGQGYATYIERKLNTSTFYLLGDTKS